MSQPTKDPVQRRAELGAAVLLLVTAAASITGEILLAPILNAADLLAAVGHGSTTVVIGALLWSVNNLGIVFIAVFLYPFLRQRNPLVAAAYLSTRIIEGAVMMAGVGATLLMVFVAKEAQTGSDVFPALARLLKEAKVMGISKLSLPLLGLGGLVLTWFLYRTRLVPTVIALTGVAGYLLVLLGGLAGWFDLLEASPFAVSSLLAIPVAVFEIVLLPFWLFFKGFRTSDRGAV